MRNRLFVTSALAVGLSMGAPNANAARVFTATETTGMTPSDFISFFDSGQASGTTNLCPGGAVNEDLNACFVPTYSVPVSAGLINPAFIPAGATQATLAVDINDGPGSDTPNNASDQLYLTVATAGAIYNLTWCWDSDLEPNVVICTTPGTGPVTHVALTETTGYMDLTPIFTGPSGPFLQSMSNPVTVRALSEAPEPSSLALVGSLLAVGALYLRRRMSNRTTA